MFFISSNSYPANNSAIYNVVAEYLNLPTLAELMHAQSAYKDENGWIIEVAKDVVFRRVNNIIADDVEVCVIWNDDKINIDCVTVAFVKDAYLPMRNEILDDIEKLGAEPEPSDEPVRSPLEQAIINVLEPMIQSAYTTAKMMEYKILADRIDEHYFTPEGLQAIAKRFRIAL